MALREPVEKMLAHHFKDEHLLEEALQVARPRKHLAKSSKNKGNKRLALIGDTLIQLPMLDDWYTYGATVGES